MSVGAFLAIWIDSLAGARRAIVLKKASGDSIDHRFEASLRTDPKADGRTAPIVGCQDTPARRIDRHVARSRAA